MLKARLLPLAVLPLLLSMRCGGDDQPGDGGTDAKADAPAADAGKDSSVDAGKDANVIDASLDAADDGGNDGAIDASFDAPMDATTDASDASIDSPADASLDVAPVDGGAISAISGLVLWLDAAQGVTTNGNDIATWADQSTQKNDATGGNATPTLVSTSINGLPAAHFVSTSGQYVSVADATSLEMGTADFYIAVVAKYDNDPNGGAQTGIGALFGKLGQASGLVFLANDLDYNANTFAAGLSELEDPTTEVQTASTYNDGTARLYAVERVSGASALRVNGSQVATSTSSVDVSEPGVEVDIGALAGAGEAALDGDIAEMIVVKGTLASGDRTTIEAYLESKYGL